MANTKQKAIFLIVANLLITTALFAQVKFQTNPDVKQIEKGQLIKNEVGINHMLQNKDDIKSLIYENDFNNNAKAWKMSGEWQYGQPISKIQNNFASTECMGVRLNSNYSNSWESVLKSPVINLPKIKPGEELKIYFDEFYEIESEYDYGVVYILTEEGEKIKSLGSRTGYSNWRNTMIDVSAFANQEIQLAFVFHSDQSDTFLGWYIDNVIIAKQNIQTERKAKADTLIVTLKSLNSANFPFIYMNVAVDLNSEALQTLDISNFAVYEDGVLQLDYFEVTPPEEGGSSRLADIIFLVDNSGSFDVYQNAAQNNMISFVNQLALSDIDYALGLCRFGASELNGNPILEDAGELTTDIDYFKNNVWQRNVIDGGTEPAYDAITQSLLGFNFRPGSQKILIILADEYPDQGTATQQDAIDACLNSSATLFALTIYDSQDLNFVATETNGNYYNITDPFNDILDDIGSVISNSYLVRYASSNPTLDGVEREVEVEVEHDGTTEFAFGSYIPGQAPEISLTQQTLDYFSQSWPEQEVFNIEVEIIDNVTPFVQSATLFYRNSTSPSYQSTPMTNTSGDFWEATIDPNVVLQPGVDFYISATDNQSTSTAPSTQPSLSPFQIGILPNMAPVIVHSPISSVMSGAPILITAEITDNTNYLEDQYLYFRKTGQLTYMKVEMTNVGGDVFEAEIPGVYVTVDGIDYYIEAIDNFGVTTDYGTADDPYQPGVIDLNEIAFKPDVNGWSFENSEEVMWPEFWWSQFDYSEYPYPWDWRNFESQRFPDWPSFVDAFGVGPSYMNPPPGRVVIDPKAFVKWEAISRGINGQFWKGSGFGMAITSLMIFDGLLTESDFDKSVNIYELEINDEIRTLIHKYNMYQYGKEQQIHMNNVWDYTPKQTLAAVKASFASEEDHIVLSMKNYVSEYKNGDGGEVIQGGHAVVPYKIIPHDSLPEEYIYVYDNLFPGDSNYITINTSTNTWSYEPLEWGYHKGLLPRESIVNYAEDLLIPKSSDNQFLNTRKDTNEYLTVYRNGFDEVVIVNSAGDTIGYVEGELFQNVANGHPIIIDNPFAGESPVGYFIEDGEYNFEIKNYEDTTALLSILTDTASYKYQRDDVQGNEVDKVSFKEGINVTNNDPGQKKFNLETILKEGDEKKVFSIKNCKVSNGDSVKFNHSIGKKLQITNLGNPNTYDLGLKISTKNNQRFFEHKNIQFNGNSRHRIKSTFGLGKGGELTIEVDEDLDGSFEDSLVVENEYVPPPPIVYSAVICEDEPIPGLAATGEELIWYSDTSLTAVLNTGNYFPSTINAPGEYIYYVTQTLFTIESEPVELILKIDSKQIPAVPDAFACEGEEIPNLVASGENIKWYADENLTNLLHTGNTFTTGQQNAGTYTYYVMGGNEGCGETETQEVNLTIFDGPPSAPEAINRTFCQGQTPYLTANGNNLTWYSDAALTNQVASGSLFYPQDLGTDTYTYYVTQSLESCGASEATEVTLTINPVPAAPAVTDEVACEGGSIPELSASGSNLTWYANQHLTQSINSGNTFATGETEPGVYEYYVTQFVGTCQSEAAVVSLTIDPLPLKPSIPSGLANLCDNTGTNNYVISSVQHATEYNWQIMPENAGTISGTTTSATVDWDNSFTGMAYISVQGENSCGTGEFSQELTVNVNTVPAQAQTPSGPVEICNDVMLSSYYIPALNNATMYQWSLDPSSAGTLLVNNNSVNLSWNAAFTGNASLTVQGVNNCGAGSASSALSISRLEIPDKPTITRDVDNLVSSSTTGNQWFSQSSGLLMGETDQVFTPNSTGSYYVMVSNGSCYSLSGSFYFIMTKANEIQAQNKLRIYPNPFSEKTIIEFDNEGFEPYDIIVRDLSGKTVYSQTGITGNKIVLSAHQFEVGYYMVEVIGDKVYKGNLLIR